jgi:hypothetical protein
MPDVALLVTCNFTTVQAQDILDRLDLNGDGFVDFEVC